MQYKQIIIESLLKKIITKDKLFNGNYTIDPYQNCEFGCLYCDSSIDKIVYVKTNAADVFEKELEKISKGIIIVGSVNDPYQNAEKTFKITEKLLKIIQQKKFSCHILTKSDLILRDVDILSEIKNCTVTVSIVSTKVEISKFFENISISTKDRLKVMKKLSDSGINTGLAIIPILPYLVEEDFSSIIKLAKKFNAQHIVYKTLELKGDQKFLFMDLLKSYRFDLVDKYKKLYMDSYKPNDDYITRMNKKLDKICKNFNLKSWHN